MNNKHKQMLNDIQRLPPPADLKWDDFESLVKALGGTVSQGKGSRVRVSLKGIKATFHQPHPGNEIGRIGVKGICQFFRNAKIIT